MSEQRAGDRTSLDPGSSGDTAISRPGQDVIIFGFGRSGTTWIAQVLARTGMEMVFEPLQPRHVPEIGECKSPYQDLSLFWYLERDDEFEHEDIVRRAITGRLRNDWTIRSADPDPPRRKVVKVIRANLMADWLLTRLPLNPLFVVRNPLAVVASAVRAGWYNNRDGLRFPPNLPLLCGPLEEFRDLIASALDPVEILATTWCINHYIPKKVGLFQRVHCVNYDRFVLDPLKSFQDLARSLHFDLNADAIDQISRRSFTTAGESLKKGYAPNTAWKKFLSREDVKRIQKIVERFDLSEFISG